MDMKKKQLLSGAIMVIGILVAGLGAVYFQGNEVRQARPGGGLHPRQYLSPLQREAGR